MNRAHVFVTGPFGNVGAHTIAHLCAQGFDVTCFDIPSKQNKNTEANLSKKHRFKTIWGDLTDFDSVKEGVKQSEPDAIIHIAAIIAPIAFIMPNMAYRVNVIGTKNLIKAAQSINKPPKFINVSSYSVHGPQNPHKQLQLLHGDSPVNPTDNYAMHKVIGEKMVSESGLDWTTIRLPAVMATSSSWGQHPAFLTFGFLLCLDHNQHMIDSRDAGLALANAVDAKTSGRNFIVAGPDDCRMTYRELSAQLMGIRGIKPFPESAFRLADPTNDATWYCENFVDTSESQAILKYQQHSFADYIDLMSHQYRYQRFFLRLIQRPVKNRLEKLSTTINKPQQIDTRPLWEVICDRFELDPATLHSVEPND